MQVSLFLEALFSRCAADVLARRTEEESAPLRLLTDASFYEMEAVAHCGTCHERWEKGMGNGRVQTTAAVAATVRSDMFSLTVYLCA